MKHKILYLLFGILVIYSCGQKQEYDYKENHPLHNQHDYDNKTNEEVNVDSSNFKNLVKEFEDQERVIWQKPNVVIEQLGNLSDKVVADIGAGTGYFAFRLAEEAKKVIAIDIDPRFITYMDSIKNQFPESLQNNFETRLADTDNPQLNDNEVDAIIMVNTYSYIGNRIEYFTNLRKGMKSGGKLLIVDYKKRKLPEGQGPPEEMRVAVDSVEQEMELAGFRLMETDDTTLEYQYIVIVLNP